MDIQLTLPWTERPLIVNAPMGGIAGSDLAIAVTQAGGLGQVGAVDDMDDLASQLQKVDASLERNGDLLPIGVGLLLFITNQDAAMTVLQKYRPSVVWLFGEQNLDDYPRWAERIRQTSDKTQIWIQIGSVEAALKVARSTRPNVLCVQGSDAGGHGYEKGAGVISLVPEVSDALARDGFQIPLVAAGGIADGRGVAAALMLGARGVVMGTRFLSARETRVHSAYRAAVLASHDGGQSTTRCKIFDELKGPNPWPERYDGRGVVMESYHDYASGVNVEEIRRRHAQAVTENGGFGSDGKGRAAMWAGTAVGLVTKEEGAGEIVTAVREGALTALKTVST